MLISWLDTLNQLHEKSTQNYFKQCWMVLVMWICCWFWQLKGIFIRQMKMIKLFTHPHAKHDNFLPYEGEKNILKNVEDLKIYF